MSEQDALDQLQELLKAHAALIEAQDRANELKGQELEIRRLETENKARELDQERERLNLERERLNRAEARLQEVLQRYVGLADCILDQGKQVSVLVTYFQKSAFGDDAHRDFLEWLSERIARLERGQMLNLMERVDSPQVQRELQATINGHAQSLTKESKRRQLTSYRKSLNKLEERRAEGDEDLEVLNKIERIKEEIIRLESELSR